MKRRIIILLIILGQLAISWSQDNRIDSLTKVINNVKNDTQLASDYYNLGIEYFRNGLYPEANEYIVKALKIYESENDEIGVAKSHEQLGSIFSEVNDYTTSLDHYLIALDLFNKNNLGGEVVNTSSNIAALYLKMEKYDKVFLYLFKSNSYYDEHLNKYDQERINNYFMLGITYGSVNKLDSALYYFNQCKRYYVKDNNVLQLAGLLNNIGAIHSKREENELAMEEYGEALSLFRKLKNEKGIGVTLGNIAFVYQKKKEYEKAIENYTVANNIFDSIGALHYLSTNYNNLSDLFADKGDFEKALFYKQKFIELNDSISNENILSSIADLEKQHAIRKKDQELLLMEKQSEIERNHQYLLIAAISMVVVILIFIAIYLRSSLQRTRLTQELTEKKQEQLKSELKYKNKELEQFALKIVEKNEFLTGLKKEISTLQSENEGQQRVKSIQANINQNLNIDHDRKELEMQIDEVHQNFLRKLEHRFPELTKTEKRLSSLLMLELSTKEIAGILNIAPESVKKSRHRLRKKLDLGSESTFTQFFSEL